jgi:hypothetical protein
LFCFGYILFLKRRGKRKNKTPRRKRHAKSWMFKNKNK